MPVLTPDERRGAATVVLLLCLGAGHDLWRLWTAPRDRGPVPAPVVVEARPAAPDSGPPGEARQPGPSAVQAQVVDLNRAGVRELDALPGIGPVLAARIVAHRERHGPFRRPEELLAVRGIGPRLYARLAGSVRVGPPAAAPTTAVRAGPEERRN